MSDALDARARRAARREGWFVRKSRWRAGTVDNFGGYMIVDLSTNIPLGGFRYDLSAEEVLEFCTEGGAQ
jgi:hypothetical protein